MYEAILTGAIIIAGMIVWNMKLENVTIRMHRKHLEKKNNKPTTVFIDPR
jgi:hypothetical protein